LSLHRGDFVYAAEIRNKCRVKGVTVTTIDAQIAAAAIDHSCTLLTTDADFRSIARLFPLRLA
jgi:predicted nucleic acid-binding protein